MVTHSLTLGQVDKITQRLNAAMALVNVIGAADPELMDDDVLPTAARAVTDLIVSAKKILLPQMEGGAA